MIASRSAWPMALMAGMAAFAAPALASTDCPGNPDALGTSRVMEVDTATPLYVGMQYRKKLPLAPMEVVLTYDDGPVPVNTDRTVAALDRECVKATFFIVGRMARAYPDVLRRTAASGHSIGYHTMTHPLGMVRWPIGRAQAEIETGWRTVDEILFGTSSDQPMLSFFRYPGLFNSAKINAFLDSKQLGVFAADATGNDWVKGYDGPKVLARALMELDQQKGGILLLHDIKDSTSSITAPLLRELKKRGYKVVHMVQKRPLPALVAPQTVAGTPVPVQQRTMTPPPPASPSVKPVSTSPQPMPVVPRPAGQPQSVITIGTPPASAALPTRSDLPPLAASPSAPPMAKADSLVTGTVPTRETPALRASEPAAPALDARPAAPAEPDGWFNASWKSVKGWFGY